MMDYRAQRQYYRAQRRAWRRQRRGYFGGIGGIIWLIIILSIVTSHTFWALFPLLFFGIPFFFWVIRPMLFGALNQPQPPYGQPNYQPPDAQGQPYYQPGYQQPVSEEQPYYEPPQPVYQPYAQGYTPQQPAAQSDQPHEAYEESSQPAQYQEGRKAQQYEEPMTMYPQE